MQRYACVCVCVCVCVSVSVCVCVCEYVCVLSLVCMAGIMYVYVDTVFGFYGYFFFFLFNCLAGCLSMIVWTPAVLGVFYACVLHFCTCTCSVQLSMFHMERRSRNTLIITIIISIIISITQSKGSNCVVWINLYPCTVLKSKSGCHLTPLLD